MSRTGLTRTWMNRAMCTLFATSPQMVSRCTDRCRRRRGGARGQRRGPPQCTPPGAPSHPCISETTIEPLHGPRYPRRERRILRAPSGGRPSGRSRTDFVEPDIGEVRRIHLLGTWVNKGIKKGRDQLPEPYSRCSCGFSQADLILRSIRSRSVSRFLLSSS